MTVATENRTTLVTATPTPSVASLYAGKLPANRIRTTANGTPRPTASGGRSIASAAMPASLVGSARGRGIPRFPRDPPGRTPFHERKGRAQMKARDIMSGGATCIEEDATLVQAAERLASEDIGSMPICGRDNRLKGVLTDRDIVVKAIAKGKDVAKTLVSELAEGKPVTIGADDSVDETL